MTYLNDDQISQLLKPINAKRVGKDRKNNSHVEAYEIRAHLIRVFGPARWSQTVERMELIFETIIPDDKGIPDRVTVAYRAQVSLSVFSPDGVDPLATFSEWAMGDAQNFPIKSRGDAHDFAIKTAESQAFKRCAMNLGDQFGLSLYQKGSTAALVMQTLIAKPADATEPPKDVTTHITEPLPAEDTAPEVAPETRERTRTSEPPVDGERQKLADEIAARILAGPGDGDRDRKAWVSAVTRDAARAKVFGCRVRDTDGNDVQLKALIEWAARSVTGP